MKLLMMLTLTAACNLAAADLPVKWAGVMKLPTGPPASVYVTLQQEGEAISGTLAYQDESRQIPLEKAELHGD
jgi:hypothetical protein